MVSVQGLISAACKKSLINSNKKKYHKHRRGCMFFKNIYLRGKQRKVKMLAQQYY